MAEPVEESGAEGAAPASAVKDAGLAATALAIAVKRRGAKADDRLDAFLDRQGRLIDLQTEHLHEQRELVLSRLRWGRFSDRIKAVLQLMTAVVGLAVATAVTAMAWQAHEDHGLVVDAFSVPPDLAREGLTGEVAAGRFLDRLQVLQKATSDSDRPTQSFQNDWGAQIKVEIPDTGLTFGEFEKLLHEKLGHQSRVSGEVLTTPTGIAITARVGDAPPRTFAGPRSAFDDLAQQAAESVFRQSQPYRFAEYLDSHGRSEEAFQVISDLALTGPDSERGWAYAEWALMDLNDHGDVASARLHAARGLGFTPGADIEDRISLVAIAVWSGHEEADLQSSKLIELEARKRQPDTSPLFYSETRLLGTAWLQFVSPDYRASAATWMQTATQQSKWTDSPLSTAMAATAMALDHDPQAARATMATAGITDEAPLMTMAGNSAFTALPIYWTAAETGDLPAALADVRHVDAWLETTETQRPLHRLMQQVWIWPLEALALARSGDPQAAQALIERTAPDCYLCLRVRGQIAAEQKDWPTASRWFSEAARQGPSLPFAQAEWGKALLAKGDVDAAIARLSQAHMMGPHFADPMELWGEALMKKGDLAGAVAKFAEADRSAPHWGRNHLRWGQALARLGRRKDAQAQVRTAQGLDLSAGDRAELAILANATGGAPRG